MTENLRIGRHKPASTLKTYSHLAPKKKIPTEYELATTGLLYYPGRGFEVETPISKWYETYQAGSLLECKDWDEFSDPRQMTYGKYVAARRLAEAHADALLETVDETGYDARLDADWLPVIEHAVGALRHPLHGLQMASAYLGSMAPSGRVAVVLLLQTADVLRAVQRLSYRMVQLRGTIPGFGERALALWEKEEMWQPLRKVIEKLLVTYDFGEALVATNLCVKPAVEELFLVRFASEARKRGDPMLEALYGSFWDDFAWQREWTRALFEQLFAASSKNREIVSEWRERWIAEVAPALGAFAPLFGEEPDEIRSEVERRLRRAVPFGDESP